MTTRSFLRCSFHRPHRTGHPRLSLLALAVGAALLSACHWPGGGRVDELNNLRGPTRDLTVELREGTNMAAAPSPDGRHIVFSAQGALWIIAREGGPARRITDYRVEPTAPVWSPARPRAASPSCAMP